MAGTISMTKSFLIFRRIYVFLGTILLTTVHNNFSGLFFGIPFIGPNPDFVQSVESQLSPESKLLIVNSLAAWNAFFCL
jgi:hypothetical protein